MSHWLSQDLGGRCHAWSPVSGGPGETSLVAVAITATVTLGSAARQQLTQRIRRWVSSEGTEASRRGAGADRGVCGPQMAHRSFTQC